MPTPAEIDATAAEVAAESKISTPQDRPTATNGQRAGSWAIEPAPGAYAAVRAWDGPDAWFDAVMDALATPEGEVFRASVNVKRAMFLRVADAERKAADNGTGRGVATAHKTAALQLGVSVSSVRRSRALLVLLGASATVAGGRYLYADERAAAQAHHGNRQIRAASTRALTMPTLGQSGTRNEHLPRRGQLLSKSSVPEMVKNQRANARASIDQASQAKTTPNRRTFTPWPADLYRFAVELSTRLPWLARQHHPASVCAMLNRIRITPDRWTVAALLDAINAGTQRAGILTVQDSGRQHNPIAYTAWLIKTTIDLDAPTPLEAQRARWAVQDQARRDQAAAAAAEAARVRSIDWALNAQIKAESDRQIAAMNRARKFRHGR